jgi:hypothetical protein
MWHNGAVPEKNPEYAPQSGKDIVQHLAKSKCRLARFYTIAVCSCSTGLKVNVFSNKEEKTEW